MPLQFVSLYDGQEVFVWSNCLLDLGTDFLIGNMIFAYSRSTYTVNQINRHPTHNLQNYYSDFFAIKLLIMVGGSKWKVDTQSTALTKCVANHDLGKSCAIV